MTLSVVIRTKDEADRLRLTLASLSRQNQAAEVVVVNDGSSDHTARVLEEAATRMALTVVHHARPAGRSEASNAGARKASGDILMFLDGDTLAGPGCLAAHVAAHGERRDLMGRGVHNHLRCTRFLLDPEAGTPRPEEAERLARTPPAELDRLRVTMRQVLDDFDAISRRAERGIYPGAAPRRLQELELEALRDDPECPVLWTAASGANFSLAREAFLSAGGFNPEIDNNEHRELALRLTQRGLKMTLVADAATYHLTHRSGWRDPLKDMAWEQVFFGAHPLPVVKLLGVFWSSISQSPILAEPERIHSLGDLARAATGATGIDYDAVRARLGLQRLDIPTPATDLAR